MRWGQRTLQEQELRWGQRTLQHQSVETRGFRAVSLSSYTIKAADHRKDMHLR